VSRREEENCQLVDRSGSAAVQCPHPLRAKNCGFWSKFPRARVDILCGLTVCSRTGPKGAEIVLEPNSHRPALASQNALYDAVFPAHIRMRLPNRTLAMSEAIH
jgi:hypothetical protein